MYYLLSQDNNNYYTVSIKTTTVYNALEYNFLKGNALFSIK